ncbi:choice-of-anchor Q domain-containing protein, partial [Crocosphaera sp.]|uniref:choice-of-anchor Q domain-containing protein n=1 Tax=Crocosphaera sp. TaxID=2729996 RepID=UPI00257D75E5
SGTVTADNNNLFGNSSQSNSDAFVNFTSGANDINATTDGENVALDNILDPDGLQDNGGSTKTIALVTDSPAINAGNNDDNLSTDQRGTGFERVINQQVDIGAYEWSIFELEVNTLNDEDDGIADGEISLREALGAISEGGTITFADSIANGTITLYGTELVINKSVTIDGDTDNITVSGNNNSRVFNPRFRTSKSSIKYYKTGVNN